MSDSEEEAEGESTDTDTDTDMDTDTDTDTDMDIEARQEALRQDILRRQNLRLFNGTSTASLASQGTPRTSPFPRATLRNPNSTRVSQNSGPVDTAWIRRLAGASGRPDGIPNNWREYYENLGTAEKLRYQSNFSKFANNKEDLQFLYNRGGKMPVKITPPYQAQPIKTRGIRWKWDTYLPGGEPRAM